MITVRKAEERGRSKIDWLDSRHTFSFGEYHDRRFMGFRALRVINDDRVAPAAGFPTHGHRDMEIISYVLDGKLEHRDSLGTGSTIVPGDVQRMSAGSGVRHSEYNPSPDEPVRFLQIWILPEQEGIAPGYEQRAFPAAETRGRLRLVAARDGREGAVTVHQDVAVWAARLDAGERARHELAAGRHAWVQVARGTATVNGKRLEEGDGAALSDERAVELEGIAGAELLVFDLA
jgi:quercetin 2,3-dioxygenase